MVWVGCPGLWSFCLGAMLYRLWQTSWGAIWWLYSGEWVRSKQYSIVRHLVTDVPLHWSSLVAGARHRLWERDIWWSQAPEITRKFDKRIPGLISLCLSISIFPVPAGVNPVICLPVQTIPVASSTKWARSPHFKPCWWAITGKLKSNGDVQGFSFSILFCYFSPFGSCSVRWSIRYIVCTNSPAMPATNVYTLWNQGKPTIISHRLTSRNLLFIMQLMYERY